MTRLYLFETLKGNLSKIIPKKSLELLKKIAQDIKQRQQPTNAKAKRNPSSNTIFH